VNTQNSRVVATGDFCGLVCCLLAVLGLIHDFDGVGALFCTSSALVNWKRGEQSLVFGCDALPRAFCEVTVWTTCSETSSAQNNLGLEANTAKKRKIGVRGIRSIPARRIHRAERRERICWGWDPGVHAAQESDDCVEVFLRQVN
jgi:hypothetical protein